MTKLRKCSIRGCIRPYHAKRYCSTHYVRWLKYGDARVRKTLLRAGKTCKEEKCERPAWARDWGQYHYQKLVDNGPCSVQGCERRSLAKGLCHLHYHRKKSTGSVGPVERIRAISGYTDSQGYKYINGQRAHRSIME